MTRAEQARDQILKFFEENDIKGLVLIYDTNDMGLLCGASQGVCLHTITNWLHRAFMQVSTAIDKQKKGK